MRYEDMEKSNLRNILKTIETDLPCPSRADVAKHLGLSRAAVTGLVNQLEALKLVTENGTIARPNRGRPASPLHIDMEYWQVLGASLHLTTWEYVIADLAGNILHKEVRPVVPFNIDNMISVLCTGLKETIDNWEGNLLPGVGIGVPGVVDECTGDIVYAYEWNWTERINISNPVIEATGFTPYIMNRYMLEGISEFKYANPEKLQDLVYIGFGNGIRSAILSGGEIIKGKNFSAGRLSHLQVDSKGEVCDCGRTGCLYTYASEKALMKYIRNRIAEGNVSSSLEGQLDFLTPRIIARAADEGDIVAREAMKRAAKAIAHVVVTVADVLNPDKVIIGGPTGTSKYLIASINEALDNLEYKGPFTSYAVEQARLQEMSSALGAAYIVTTNKLELATKALAEN